MVAWNNFKEDIFEKIKDPVYKDSILYETYGTLGLSLLGSFMIVLLYLFNKDLHNLSFKLTVYMTLTVILQDVSKLFFLFWTVKEEVNTNICILQGYLVNYSQLSTLFWCSIITWSLYSTVFLAKKQYMEIERFILIGCGYPISLSLIPLFFGEYGKYEIGCWITNRTDLPYEGTILRNICYFLPLLIGVLANLYMIRKVKIDVAAALPNDPSIDYLKRLQFYPLALFLILFSYIAKAIVIVFCENETVLFIVMVVTTFFSNLLGVYNLIIFGYSKIVKEIIFKFSSKYLCCLYTPRQSTSDGEGVMDFDDASFKNSRLFLDPPE